MAVYLSRWRLLLPTPWTREGSVQVCVYVRVYVRECYVCVWKVGRKRMCNRVLMAAYMAVSLVFWQSLWVGMSDVFN